MVRKLFSGCYANFIYYKALLLGPKMFVPPGHFYSPIPNREEIRQMEKRLFGCIPEEIPGVDLNTESQQDLLQQFKAYYNELPFAPQKKKGLRYFYENPSYCYSDAVFLYGMIRHFQPNRIIEVGSGFSSCCTLDTNELHFDNEIQCSFIEPYPKLLFSLLKPEDQGRVEILEKKLQDVDLALFDSLAENDLLFIDSTHVARTGSDVNYIFFEILPRLKKGVLIHFHDIFYPFEYPKDWVYAGRAWNEAYMLRSFLQYNDAFRVVMFNTYLAHFFPEVFERDFPLCLKNTGGSIWLRKTR